MPPLHRTIKPKGYKPPPVNKAKKPTPTPAAPKHAGAGYTDRQLADMDARRMVARAEEPFIWMPGAHPSVLSRMAGALRRAVRGIKPQRGDRAVLDSIESLTVTTHHTER